MAIDTRSRDALRPRGSLLDSAPDDENPPPKHETRFEQWVRLNREYKMWERDQSPAAADRRAMIKMQLDRFTHDDYHPNCGYVEVDMPTPAQGGAYSINDEQFFGTVRVPQCVASELLHLHSKNMEVERDRMREGGRIIDMGDITQRVRPVRP